MNSPCYLCKIREPHCHASCDKYKIYKDEMKTINNERKTYNEIRLYREKSIQKAEKILKNVRRGSNR